MMRARHRGGRVKRCVGPLASDPGGARGRWQRGGWSLGRSWAESEAGLVRRVGGLLGEEVFFPFSFSCFKFEYPIQI
jgi:hypothetical protein